MLSKSNDDEQRPDESFSLNLYGLKSDHLTVPPTVWHAWLRSPHIAGPHNKVRCIGWHTVVPPEVGFREAYKGPVKDPDPSSDPCSFRLH
jgi:hypothetical protein